MVASEAISLALETKHFFLLITSQPKPQLNKVNNSINSRISEKHNCALKVMCFSLNVSSIHLNVVRCRMRLPNSMRALFGALGET